MTKPYYLMPDDENYISKTDLKKEARDLQEFAKQLIKLNKKQRSELSASDELQEAFLLADKIAKKPDALRRHTQFMAKVLRDEEHLEKLKLEHEQFTTPAKSNDKLAKKFEDMRTQLIENGDPAINELIELNPSLERQKLRQLVRQAKKELSKEKPGKSYKELFQYLKDEVQS